MHKEMIHRLFLLQTSKHKEHLLGPLKFLLLSMSLGGILNLVAAQANKQTFVGALDFQTDLVAKSQPSNTSTCVEQKLLTVKTPQS